MSGNLHIKHDTEACPGDQCPYVERGDARLSSTKVKMDAAAPQGHRYMHLQLGLAL